MKEVKNPKLTAVNPHYKSKYAPLDEVLRVVNEALEPGETVRQTFLHDYQVFRTSLEQDEHTVEFVDIPFVLGKQDPQGLGSAITYHRRYGLCLLFNLVGEEDDDGNASSPSSTGRKKRGAPKKDTTNSDEFGF